jgi:SAM-dependent methyltransferase
VNDSTPPRADRLKKGAKQAMKPLVAPMLDRLYTRIDQRTDERIGVQLGAPMVSGLTDEHLRLLLDALSASNASMRELRRSFVALAEQVAPFDARVRPDLDDLRRYVADLDRRTRAERTELMYEIRYGGANRGMQATAGEQEVIEPRVVNPDKLSARPLKLNVGCGNLTFEDHVNVDGRPLDRVDIVADARNIPVEPGSVDEIYNAHVVEHFPLQELERVVLPHWVSLLRPGGVLRVVAPDAAAMIDAYGRGEMTFEELRVVTYGEQEYDGDFHFAMYSPDSLAAVMKAAGLADVQVVASGRPNGLSLEMELTGVRA